MTVEQEREAEQAAARREGIEELTDEQLADTVDELPDEGDSGKDAA